MTFKKDIQEDFMVVLAGMVGDIEMRGMERLQKKDFSYSYIAADLDFNQNRIFTNFSGDVSGRFIELMAMASKGDKDYHPALRELLEAIPKLQKDKGHFGVEVDWEQPIDKSEQGEAKMMPIFWGSSRMLLGLVEAWKTFGDASLLEAAKKLADFYIHTADFFCNPARLEEYRETGSYFEKYAPCYFPGMEGLLRLYEAINEKKYLDQAERMAKFRHEYGFDQPPIVHSHGYLCCEYSLLLLFSLTRKPEYLIHVEKACEDLVATGHIGPCGGILEKAEIGYPRDEGCALADWLRLNLELWRQSGKGQYLDMAGRILFNHFAVNQCKTGGFGCRFVQSDTQGQIGYGKYDVEAPWCCDFHGAMATQILKRYLVTSENDILHINLPVDFSSTATLGQTELKVVQSSILSQEPGVLLKQRVDLIHLNGTQNEVYVALHLPDWAEDIQMEDSKGRPITLVREGYEMRTERKIVLGEWVFVTYIGGVTVENRRCARMDLTEVDFIVKEAVLRYGPTVLTLKGWNEVPFLIMPKSIDGKKVDLHKDFYVHVLTRIEAEEMSSNTQVNPDKLCQLVQQGAMSDETESIFVFDLLLT